jgi:hypothetical protein
MIVVATRKLASCTLVANVPIVKLVAPMGSSPLLELFVAVQLIRFATSQKLAVALKRSAQ